MKHNFYAEPVSPAKKTWVVYIVGDGVVIERVRADDAASAIEKAKNRIKRIAKDI